MDEQKVERTVFFCIGAAKSGTTLLARVLDQHPDIACIWESYALHPRSRSSIFNPASNSWQTHGFVRQDVIRWASIWRAQPQSFLRRILRRLTGRPYLVTSPFQRTMSEALADFSRRCHARVVGDKWPWYINYLDQVLEAFPQARFIHNVRDPRGLWNSAQRFKGRQRGNELLQRMLEQERRVMPYLTRKNFHVLRYEDLVYEPEKTCRHLYAFLGCDYAPEYLTYHPKADPYPQRWDWVPQASQPFDPRHASKWNGQMTPDEIERVSCMAGWFIDKYGYRSE
jgi:hypothetical protein